MSTAADISGAGGEKKILRAAEDVENVHAVDQHYFNTRTYVRDANTRGSLARTVISSL